jgi:hypothetical protein
MHSTAGKEKMVGKLYFCAHIFLTVLKHLKNLKNHLYIYMVFKIVASPPGCSMFLDLTHWN